MQTRKPKFQGKKNKWEKRRIVKKYTRQLHGKKPVVEPLTIAPSTEREAALKKGKIVLYSGRKKVELNLIDGRRGNLQGVFRDFRGNIIALRSREDGTRKRISFYTVQQNKVERLLINSFAFREPSGQIQTPKELEQQGLGLKTASKIERELRAKSDGQGTIYNDCDTIQALYGKLGYYRDASAKEVAHIIYKFAKHNTKDNLDKFHRIEAIDPKTGKARIFTFLIKNPR